jgi:hypothetical protein
LLKLVNEILRFFVMVKATILIFLTILVINSAYTQTNVAGKVINEDNEEIGFAHVFNKTNGLGKVSDMFGKFDLIASKGDTIQFSFVGYQTLLMVVNPIHLSSYLKIMLPEDPVLLPSITIFADENFRVPLNFKSEPIFIEGVTITTDKPPIRPGQLIAGTTSTVGDIPAGGVTINGPLTYFSRDEKEKRKAVEVKEETAETITYQKFITQDSIRNRLMAIYQIDSSQYSRVVTRLNLQNPGIQKASSPEEVWHWVIVFFNEAVPVIKVFDMH